MTGAGTTAVHSTPIADLCHETLVALRGDVTATLEDGSLVLSGPPGRLAVSDVPAAVVALLDDRAGPLRLPVVRERLSEEDRTRLDGLLRSAAFFFADHIVVDGHELLRIERTTWRAAYVPAVVPADASVRLSRFTFCRSGGDGLVVESPCSRHRVSIRDPRVGAIIAALGRSSPAAELVPYLGDRNAVSVVLGHLVGADLAEVDSPRDEEGASSTAPDAALRQWEFHDLLFHTRSRPGTTDNEFGATYPYTGSIDPAPAVRALPPGSRIPLPRPSLEKVLADDPTLTIALEGRTSLRGHGADPITLEQLSGFLYRVGRVRSRYDQGVPYELTSRPYPSGGAAYELELYPAVQRCAGLEPGVYFYDPGDHRLVLLDKERDTLRRLLQVAHAATGGRTSPDVLFTITSRITRLSWKYRGISYATTLKNVGALYQTMYLVATAMGLAPCAIGSGVSALEEHALGLDGLSECPVGNFVLSGRSAARDPDGDALSAVGENVNDAPWGARARLELDARFADNG